MITSWKVKQIEMNGKEVHFLCRMPMNDFVTFEWKVNSDMNAITDAPSRWSSFVISMAANEKLKIVFLLTGDRWHAFDLSTKLKTEKWKENGFQSLKLREHIFFNKNAIHSLESKWRRHVCALCLSPWICACGRNFNNFSMETSEGASNKMHVLRLIQMPDYSSSWKRSEQHQQQQPPNNRITCVRWQTTRSCNKGKQVTAIIIRRRKYVIQTNWIN